MTSIGKRTLCVWVLLGVLPVVNCYRMSESIKDETVGLNGGFEHVRSGLPVNWLVYSPSTIPTGDYELLFDETDFKQGRQSLKFVVRECSATGGWHSPGIAQEFPAKPGESYRISFWLKSEGCGYQVSVGGVDAKTGQSEIVDSPSEAASSWKRVEHTYTMPRQYETMRFELSIRSPGTLWIDGVKVEPVMQ